MFVTASIFKTRCKNSKFEICQKTYQVVLIQMSAVARQPIIEPFGRRAPDNQQVQKTFFFLFLRFFLSPAQVKIPTIMFPQKPGTITMHTQRYTEIASLFALVGWIWLACCRCRFLNTRDNNIKIILYNKILKKVEKSGKKKSKLFIKHLQKKKKYRFLSMSRKAHS